MMLSLRDKRPVLPIVLYLSPGAGGVTEEAYTVTACGRVVSSFRYVAICPPDLREEDYLDIQNPLVPALCALMSSEERDRVTRKMRLFERIAKFGPDEKRATALVNVVDQYLKLNATETAEWNNRMRREESKEVTTMWTQWRNGGIEEGITKGKRETLLRLMMRKFGDLPEDVSEYVRNLDSSEKLDELTDRVLFAGTLEEMHLKTL